MTSYHTRTHMSKVDFSRLRRMPRSNNRRQNKTMKRSFLVVMLTLWSNSCVRVTTAFSSRSMVVNFSPTTSSTTTRTNIDGCAFAKTMQQRQRYPSAKPNSKTQPLNLMRIPMFSDDDINGMRSSRSSRRHISTTSSEEGSRSNSSSNDSLKASVKEVSSRRMKFNAIVDKIILKAQNIPPPVQLVTLIALYVIHLTVLTQHSIVFPFQLIPNDQGRFQSIGLDSLAGIISFVTIQLLRQKQIRDVKTFEQSEVTANTSAATTTASASESSESSVTASNSKSIHDSKKKRPVVTIPSLFAGIDNYENGPWKFPKPSPDSASPRITSMVALGMLLAAYFFTGRLAAMVELYMYALAGLGVPMTIAMHRSLVVLGGHMAWVLVGSGILGILLRPRPFFGGGGRLYEVEVEDTENGTNEGNVTKIIKQKYRWYTNKWKTNWMWWTIGGYFISSWFFNIADFLNQMILPAHVFELAGEGVVSQLINPENNDIAASLVGYIAPCISAPWWEEVLYRGFLLPALCLQMRFWPAVFVSGVVFSVHHVSTTGAIPLAILGWTWAALYAKCGNLLVTILIHAMWNSRVFLGSWLGL